MIIDINKTEGYALVSQFVLKETEVTQLVLKNTWDLGDGTIYYDASSVSHIYKVPGEYSIYYKSIDFEGVVVEFKKNITVKSKVYDAITFVSIPEFYGDPGKPSGIFTVNITSANIFEDIYIDLHAANSKSLPLQFAKTDHVNITPVWYFTSSYINSNTGVYDKLDNIKVSTVPITAYSDSDSTDVVVCGVSGVASFRYVDSVATGVPEYEKPILITATLRTSAFTYYKDSSYINFDSYSNSNVKSATIAWQTNYLPVGSLRLLQDDMNTSRGINNVNWTYSTIPFVVTARNTKTTFASAGEVESINYSYPDVESTNITENVNKTFITILTSNNANFISDTTIYEKPTSECCTEYSYTNTTTTLNTSGFLLSSYYCLRQDNNIVNNLLFKPYDTQGITSHGILYASISSTQPCDYAQLSAVSYVRDINIEAFIANKEFVYPARFAPQPNIFLSSINDRYICKFRLTPFASVYKKELDEKYKNTIIGSYKNYFLTEGANKDNNFNYQLTGESGVFNVAYCPIDNTTVYSNNSSLSSTSSLYATDSLSDTIYKLTFFYDSSFEYSEIKSKTLVDILTGSSFSKNILDEHKKKNYALGHIAIDGCRDIYVSLYNSDKILKLDNNLNVKNVISPVYPKNKTIIVTGLSSNTFNIQHNLNTTTPLLSVYNITNPNVINQIQTNINDSNNTQIILPDNVEIKSQTLKIDCQIKTYTNTDIKYKQSFIQTDKFNRLWSTYSDTEDGGVAVYDHRGALLDLLRFNKQNSTILTRTVCDSMVFGYHYDDTTTTVHDPCAESQRNRRPHNYTWLCLNDNVYENNILTKKDRGRILGIKDVDLTLGVKKLKDFSFDEYITPFRGIFNICLDRKGNLWFLHGTRYFSVFNIKTKDYFTYYLNLDGVVETVPNNSCLYTNENSHFTGFSVDVYNRLIIVDSFTNCVFSFTEINNKLIKTCNANIYPQSNTNHFINNENKILTDFKKNKKSLYAYGDFTGNKWYQTYIELPLHYTVSGVSNVFSIRDLFTSKYNFRRKNESFDMSKYMQSLALPEYMQEYDTLFDIIKITTGTDTTVYSNLNKTEKFETYIKNYNRNTITITHSLGSGDVSVQLYIVDNNLETLREISQTEFTYKVISKNNILLTSLGNTNNSYYNYKIIITNISKIRNVSDVQDLLGVKIYERVSNFLENNTDIDTCNVQQLQSNAAMLGVSSNNFFETHISELQRLLDVGSIPFDSLWGKRYKEVVATESYNTIIGDGESKFFVINHNLNNTRLNVYTYIKQAAPYNLIFKGVVDYTKSSKISKDDIKNGIRKQIIDIIVKSGTTTKDIAKSIATTIPFDRLTGKRYISFLTRKEIEALKEQLDYINIVTEIHKSSVFRIKNIPYPSSIDIVNSNTFTVTITSLPLDCGESIFVDATPSVLSVAENLTAGELIGIKNTLTNEQLAITVPVLEKKLDTGTVYERVYPASALYIPGTILDVGILGETILISRLNYLSAYPVTYDNGVIDWNSEFTTLDPNINSKQWYADGGILEDMFNAYLTRYLCITG